jgi:hypothetical protein
MDTKPSQHGNRSWKAKFEFFDYSGTGMLEAFLASAPAEVGFVFAVIDDDAGRLEPLVRCVLPELEPRCRRYRMASPSDLEPHLEALLACHFLLINAHVDLHPPGELLYTLLAIYGRKTPVRLFVFVDNRWLAGVSSDLVRRGATAVLPLDEAGIHQLARHLTALEEGSQLWTSRSLSLRRPQIAYAAGVHLPPRQEDLVRLLFVEAARVDIAEAGRGDLSTRRLIVETDQQRQYFVKIGRWDSITAEYANYLNLVEGKHENYAGRAIEPPLIRGSEAALRFSFAGAGRATSTPLAAFLHRATASQGEQLLRGLRDRLSRNLTLQRQAFDPLKFLRVLPALLHLEDGTFVVPGEDGTRSTRGAMALEAGDGFPPPQTSRSRGQQLRTLLENVQHQLAQPAPPTVVLRDLAIQEIRAAADGSGVIVQLTDTAADGVPVVGYKVNVQINNRALLTSLKLQRGGRVHVYGAVRDTLLTLLRRQRPSWHLRGWHDRWRPEDRLYDLLFGQPDGQQAQAGVRWQESPLTVLQPVPVGDFTHGDFNLHNILVETREHEAPIPWLIDFERSSRDFYPAFDWAKLEVEIAMHLSQAQEVSIPELLRCEHALWCPRRFEEEVWVPARVPGGPHDLPLQKVLHWEDTLRRLAAEALATPAFADYLFGVLCYSLRALSFAPTAFGKARVYVKAAVACKRLDQILADIPYRENEAGHLA